MKIEKKVWPEFFQAILDGQKNFEVRLGDFEGKVGDTLVLKEYDPATKKYTGRVLEKEITYLLNTKDITFWPKKDVEKLGLVVMGLKP